MYRSLLLATLVVVLAGCSRSGITEPLFVRLDPSATGVTFANNLPEEPGFNIVEYLYY